MDSAAVEPEAGECAEGAGAGSGLPDGGIGEGGLIWSGAGWRLGERMGSTSRLGRLAVAGRDKSPEGTGGESDRCGDRRGAGADAGCCSAVGTAGRVVVVGGDQSLKVTAPRGVAAQTWKLAASFTNRGGAAQPLRAHKQLA
jgi:hypothetical protein